MGQYRTKAWIAYAAARLPDILLNHLTKQTQNQPVITDSRAIRVKNDPKQMSDIS